MSLPEKDDSYASRIHVLVVDDDRRIRDLVSRYLAEQGFIVMTASSASQALAILKSFSFDVLVVDVMMPGESGLALTPRIRALYDVPVLLLTALGEAQDRIAGLEAGADDYLPKPFEPRELVLRLQAIARRRLPALVPGQGFKMGRWVFDPALSELRDGSVSVSLTETDCALLKALAARAGLPVSREELARICGFPESGERTVDVQVTRLRRKIEQDTRRPRYLQTVR
ncbi:MAG: response regulator, partial [Alphaproteobacteria bacterium]|nr:response regulator [Alphaproteobacteria bacterium]